MDGLPSNTPQEQARVDASAAIHARSRMVLRGVLQAAEQAGFAQCHGISQTMWISCGRWQRTAHGSPPARTAGTFILSPGHFAHRSKRSAASRAPATIHSGRIRASPEPTQTACTSLSLQHNTPHLLPSNWHLAWHVIPRPLASKNCSISDFAQLLPESYVPRRPRLCGCWPEQRSRPQATQGPLRRLAQSMLE